MENRPTPVAHLIVLILMVEAASGLTIREIIEQRSELTKVSNFKERILQ